MASSLSPCPSCSRHVKTTEARCPFCGSAFSEIFAQSAIAGPTQRLSRAAAFAFTASLAVQGCGGTTSTVSQQDSGTGDGAHADSGQTTDSGGVQPAYGLPAVDAGRDAAHDAADGSTPPKDDGGGIPMYGIPPIDDAGADAGGPQDDGGAHALYGAPVPDHTPFLGPLPKDDR